MLPGLGPLWVLAPIILIAIFALLAIFWFVSVCTVRFLENKYNISSEKKAEMHLQAIGGFSSILGGLSVLAAVVGVFFSINKANQDVDLAREGQLAERFTNALTSLEVAATAQGQSGSVSTKPLGGIVALEAVVVRAPRYLEPAARVLSSFIRASSPRSRAIGTCRWLDEFWLKGKPGDSELRTPRLLSDDHLRLEPHILEAFKTIGRLNTALRAGGIDSIDEDYIFNVKQSIDLSNSDLCIAYAKRADFDFGWFQNSDLRGAILDESSFRCGGFRETNLDGAHLIDTHFEYADLRRSNFGTAEITGINFKGASLAGADLRRVSYDRQRGEISAVFQDACGNVDTKLPPEVPRPAAWGERDAATQENSCNRERDRQCGLMRP